MIAKIIPTRKGGQRVVVIEDDGRVTDPRGKRIAFWGTTLKLTCEVGCGSAASVRYVPIENWWEHATVTWQWMYPQALETHVSAKLTWSRWDVFIGANVAHQVPPEAAHLFAEMLAAEDAPRSAEALAARQAAADERAKFEALAVERRAQAAKVPKSFDRNVAFSSPRASRLHPTRRALLRWLRRGGTEAEWVREVRVSCPTWLRG